MLHENCQDYERSLVLGYFGSWCWHTC